LYERVRKARLAKLTEALGEEGQGVRKRGGREMPAKDVSGHIQHFQAGQLLLPKPCQQKTPENRPGEKKKKRGLKREGELRHGSLQRWGGSVSKFWQRGGPEKWRVGQIQK